MKIYCGDSGQLAMFCEENEMQMEDFCIMEKADVFDKILADSWEHELFVDGGIEIPGEWFGCVNSFTIVFGERGDKFTS